MRVGTNIILDAQMAVDEFVQLATSYAIQDFHYWAQFPGASVESGSQRIHIADNVILQVAKRLAE